MRAHPEAHTHASKAKRVAHDQWLVMTFAAISLFIKKMK